MMSSVIKKGRLKRWNDQKGFGFIGFADGKRDVFIHISAIGSMSRRPVVGDVICYQLHTAADGRTRAINASIEGVATRRPSPGKRNTSRKKDKGWGSKAFVLVMVIVTASIAYKRLNNGDVYQQTPFISPSSHGAESQYRETFRCSGKTHCSQMTSCKEAKFYLQNCPNTKIDGDGDGVPCEKQWCRW